MLVRSSTRSRAGEDAGELGAEAVDGAGAVGDQAHAPAGEDLEVGDRFVARAKRVQVAADADLVGDDGCVFGVGLTLAAVALRGAVDGPAGDVVHRLRMVDQECDGQGGSAVGKVDVPGHLVSQGQDGGEEFEEFGFVVGDAPGQQPAAALVDRDAVVVGLACVDAGPDGCHVLPPCGVVLMPATDDLAVDSLLSDHSQFLIGSRGVVGHRAANQWKPQAAEPFEPHPAPLGGSTIRRAHRGVLGIGRTYRLPKASVTPRRTGARPQLSWSPSSTVSFQPRL